jgi:hypothetical protein
MSVPPIAIVTIVLLDFALSGGAQNQAGVKGLFPYSLFRLVNLAR